MNSLVTVGGGAAATIEPGALASLQQHAVDARGAFSRSTERALKSDTAIFTAWCGAEGVAFLPAAPATVARFVDAMAAQKAPATVRRYVSSISTFHRAAEVVNPADAVPVKLALKRMHREKGRAQAQAAPLVRPLVERMLAAAGPGLRGLRNAALLAVAYDTLCRRSELAALRREDLEIAADSSATILVRRSKTDQEGAGVVHFMAADTVRHVVAWIEAAGIADGFLFRAVLKGGRVGGPIDNGDVPRLFKAMAQAAGVSAEETARISGHSSRVGAAQDMVRYGVELPAVMQSGGWKTAEMVSRYTRRLDARHSGAAKLAVLQDRG